MNDISIEQIIGKHLQDWLDKGLNAVPLDVEPEMAGPATALEEDGNKLWVPINSTVTDEEIKQLEDQLGYRLPNSYKTFLKHKHFYELYISEARFSGQEIRHWRRHLIDMAFDGYPREFLIDKGYIPFAGWSDWGLLCFDTNRPGTNFEYPVVLWDHERYNEYAPFSENFYNLLVQLDATCAVND